MPVGSREPPHGPTASGAADCSPPRPGTWLPRSRRTRRRSRAMTRSTSLSIAGERCWRSERRSGAQSDGERPERPSSGPRTSSTGSVQRSGRSVLARSCGGSAAGRPPRGRSRRRRNASPFSSSQGRRTPRSRPSSSSPTARSKGISPGSTRSSASGTEPSWLARSPLANHRGSTTQTQGTRPFHPIGSLPSLGTDGRPGHREKEE